MTPIPPGETRWNAPPEDTPPPSSRKLSSALRVALFAAAAGFLGLTVFMALTAQPAVKPTAITYTAFLSDVGAGKVKAVNINQASGKISGAFNDGKEFTAQGPTGSLPAADLALLDLHHVDRSYVAPSSSSKLWSTILTWILPIGIMILVFVWLSRRVQGQMSGLSGWSRSKAKVHLADRPSTTFEQVAGYDGVKQELGEIVGFLKDPERFQAIGARIPKGILLVGPPGTGKTLFARAIAGEAGVAFISITGSEFMEMFVGVGAARVRDLFATAREHKPSIVFVDEIDAIGRKRGAGLGGGHDEREQTLNQLLAEMDGFEGQEGIVVLAATNRPDILDPALLRAGRFDRQIVIPLPTLQERSAILSVHAHGKQMAVGVELDKVAQGTPGMSGADLENLVNEAALIAVRRGSGEISMGDLEAARERVLIGARRTSLALSPGEKRIVAYHEAGHALAAHLLPDADPLHKVSILPTGMALGATQQLPAQERQLEQRPYLDDALAVRLAGRAAEELVFGVPSTGAQDDLHAATELAGRMVREWGMSEAVGNMAWGPRGPVFLGEDLVQSRDYSDRTARIIDIEIGRLLDAQAERARQVLISHRAALDSVALALLDKESLDGKEVEGLVAAAERRRVGSTEHKEEGNGTVVEAPQVGVTALRAVRAGSGPARGSLQALPSRDGGREGEGRGSAGRLEGPR